MGAGSKKQVFGVGVGVALAVSAGYYFYQQRQLSKRKKDEDDIWDDDEEDMSEDTKKFNRAAELFQKLVAKDRTNQGQQLKAYGLYKQATSGDCDLPCPVVMIQITCEGQIQISYVLCKKRF